MFTTFMILFIIANTWDQYNKQRGL